VKAWRDCYTYITPLPIFSPFGLRVGYNVRAVITKDVDYCYLAA
jgi:hypothetical protein